MTYQMQFGRRNEAFKPRDSGKGWHPSLMPLDSQGTSFPRCKRLEHFETGSIRKYTPGNNFERFNENVSLSRFSIHVRSNCDQGLFNAIEEVFCSLHKKNKIRPVTTKKPPNISHLALARMCSTSASTNTGNSQVSVPAVTAADDDGSGGDPDPEPERHTPHQTPPVPSRKSRSRHFFATFQNGRIAQ